SHSPLPPPGPSPAPRRASAVDVGDPRRPGRPPVRRGELGGPPREREEQPAKHHEQAEPPAEQPGGPNGHASPPKGRSLRLAPFTNTVRAEQAEDEEIVDLVGLFDGELRRARFAPQLGQ